MAKKFKVQVKKEQYFDKYDDLPRFISYFYQIDSVRKLAGKKVLEIGIGNKTVSNYLRQQGIKTDTCDFDKRLAPDFIADVRDLPMEDESYDLVMACEILEHIPWKDVDKALKEIARVSSKNAVISIPYSSASFEFMLTFPLIRNLLKKPFIGLFFRIPYFFLGMKFEGEHYWEIGRKGYPIRKVRVALRKHFKILEERRPPMNPYHQFFLLEKR
jgi:ubiquinone/menaquinone biosynthesis C-methylase UbiE